MIDVDIVGQLIPNPLTMVVQLCSTFVLFMLAKIFLWPAVKNFLDVRSQKMQSDLMATEKARQEALSDRQLAQEQLNNASGKAEEILDAAVRQAKSEKASILANAEREADATRKRAHEQIEAERRTMYQNIQQEMVEVAMAAAGKLIGEQDVEALDKDAIDAYVKEVGSQA